MAKKETCKLSLF